MEELITLIKNDTQVMYWIAGVFAILECFKWLYPTLCKAYDFFFKKLGVKTKRMLKKEEDEQRLKDTETAITEIRDASKQNVAMFLAHEKDAVGHFEDIKDEIVRELVKLDEKIDSLDRQERENKDSIDELRTEMGERFTQVAHEADGKEARRLRATIISYADSCRIGVPHTKTQFENVFRDYDEYLKICEKRGIENHFIDEELAFVRVIYQQCVSENKFL